MTNLRELIFMDFGEDLPIKGGSGNSIDNPIIILAEAAPEHVSLEYAILRYLGVGRRISWEMVGQQLMSHNGRMIDQVKIKTKQLTETQVVTQTENYYFDITECYGK